MWLSLGARLRDGARLELTKEDADGSLGTLYNVDNAVVALPLAILAVDFKQLQTGLDLAWQTWVEHLRYEDALRSDAIPGAVFVYCNRLDLEAQHACVPGVLRRPGNQIIAGKGTKASKNHLNNPCKTSVSVW